MKRNRPQRPPSVTEVFVLLALFMLVASILAYADLMIGQNLFRQLWALGYPSAPGVIVQSDLEEIRGSRGASTFRPKFLYRFQVGSQEFTGNRYRYGKWTSSKAWATGIQATYPVGAKVAVRYRPSDPSEATLIAGPEGVDLFAILGLLPFHILALGLGLALYRATYTLLHPPPPGQPVGSTTDRGNGSLSSISPVFAAMVAAGGIALVCTLMIGIGFRGVPSLPVVLAAWGAVLGGAGVAWRALHAAQRVGS